MSMPREAAAQEYVSTAIRDALPLDDAALANLRDAVRDYVADARLRGNPPEAVLAALKGCAHEALSYTAVSGDADAHTALVNLVVKLCIDEYYADRAAH